MSRLIFALTIVSLFLAMSLFEQSLHAGDWPQFRHDASRSGSTADAIPVELHLQWFHELPTPRPSFPTEVRLRFDASYEPVVLGHLMFVPSMVTDSVTAIDTSTGAERWQFFAEGPIRFAPVASGNKIYFVSDDGFLYCVDAAAGTLLWKFRGMPEDKKDRKLLGNKRLISICPARGGPVLDNGVVYFAAGLWPDDGIYLHAIDAQSGRAIWSNTNSNHIPKANMDHGVGQYAGLTPQGYLAIVNDQLVVPCGVQLPAFLNLKTGVLGEYNMGWGGREGLPKGSWFVAGAGKYLSHSGDLYDLSRENDEKFKDPRGADFKSLLYPGGFTRLWIDPTNQRALGAFSKPVITTEAMYFNDHQTGIVAYDLTDVPLEQRKDIEPTEFRAKDRYPDKWKGKVEKLWSLDSKLDVHIKAGPRLYAGGPGKVQAIEISESGSSAKVAWSSDIEGTPHRMLAADDRLFVVTREGRIFAFGHEQKKDVVVHRQGTAETATKDAWNDRAAELLKATKATDGYALVLGLNNGRLVEELVRQSQLYVIAVDTDVKLVEQLRDRLHRHGKYGTRASVHVGDPLDDSLPPYFANLVASEDVEKLGNSPDASTAARIFRMLRPYGGIACFDVDGAKRAEWSRQLTAANLPASATKQDGQFVLLARQGPLPDAADWSHDGANAANAGASQDRFLKAPLGLLWFDGSIRWHRKPGSAVVRVAHGRVFVYADDLHAIDVYTGRHLWVKRLPFAKGTRVEMVAHEQTVYAAGGTLCVALDAATGRQMKEIKTPDATGNWSTLRAHGDYLVGTRGKNLVCIDRDSGELKWRFQCNRDGLCTSIGSGKVYCAELLNTRRGETMDKSDAKTRAFDLETGELSWTIPSGSPVQYSEPFDLLLTSSGVYRGKDGSRVRDGLAKAQIAGEKVISGSPDQLVVYELLSGKKSGEDLKWFRRGCTGLRSSCNLVTTRFKANAAYIDLETRQIKPIWNIRSGCNNNLYPANGILNVPNVTGGCECNYTPTSKAFAPLAVIEN